MVLIHIDRLMAECLNRVCVEDDPVLMGDLTDLPDRLDRSDLVVGEHHRDQDRIRADRFLQLVDGNGAVLVYREVGDLIAALLEILTGVKDRVVLDLCCDDVFSFGRVSLRSRDQSPVVGLGTAICEVDLIVLCAESVCYSLSCFCEGLLARCGKLIYRGRVSVIFCIKRQHGFHDFRTYLCRSRIVEIDYFLHCSAFL